MFLGRSYEGRFAAGAARWPGVGSPSRRWWFESTLPLVIYVGKQVLTIERQVRVEASSKAEAGRILKTMMGELLEVLVRDPLDVVQQTLWGSDEAGDDPEVRFGEGKIRDWHLEGRSPLPPAFANGPSPQRLSDLLDPLVEAEPSPEGGKS